MKLSVCSGTYGKSPMGWILKRIKELGYEGIEFSVMLQIPPERYPNVERKELKRKLEEVDLEVAAFHHVFPSNLSLVSSDQRLREATIDHTKDVIKLAEDLGCKIIVLGGGMTRMRPSNVSSYQGLRWLGEAYESCGHFAQQLGVTLAIEPLNRYETNTLINFDETVNLIKDINCNAVKMMGDTYHMNIEESSFSESIAKAREYLVHIHVADSNRLAPGRGHIDFHEIVRALREIDYQGYLSLEVYAISPWMQFLPDIKDADSEVVFAKSVLEKMINPL
jgi:sugar phosphate isomerase/epimerase